VRIEGNRYRRQSFRKAVRWKSRFVVLKVKVESNQRKLEYFQRCPSNSPRSFMTLWKEVKTELLLFSLLIFSLIKETFENIFHVTKAIGVFGASFSMRALQDVLNLFFHPLQELSVQLFAQLEKDTKGTEEEAAGKGWYQFACLHKVCLRHLVRVARFVSFLKGPERVRK